MTSEAQRLDDSWLSRYCQGMPKVHKVEYPAPPALTQWQQQEARWREEAQQWVKSTLVAYFGTEAADLARTTAEIMTELLDKHPGMPSAYARLLSNRYAERYDLVRNTLEGLARNKACVIGSALNSKGRESSAYARPQNVADAWHVAVQAADKESHDNAVRGIREWLSLDGATLRNVDGVMLSRKQPGGTETDETDKATTAAVSKGNAGSSVRGAGRGPKRAGRRKPRDTSGGD